MSTRFRIIDPLGAAFYDGTPVPITTGIELKRRIFEGLPGAVGRFVLEVE